MAFTFVLLLAALIAFMNSIKASHHIQSTPPWQSNLPKKGDFIDVSNIETYWRASSQETPDVKVNVAFCPEVRITLGNQSSNGSLRVSFKNAQGKLVGDSQILHINNGVFANQSKQAQIYCTDGFLQESSLRGYLGQNTYRWSVHLLESPPNATSLNDEKVLGHAPISPLFKP